MNKIPTKSNDILPYPKRVGYLKENGKQNRTKRY